MVIHTIIHHIIIGITTGGGVLITITHITIHLIIIHITLTIQYIPYIHHILHTILHTILAEVEACTQAAHTQAVQDYMWLITITTVLLQQV